jgi:hypothetical protein
MCCITVVMIRFKEDRWRKESCEVQSPLSRAWDTSRGVVDHILHKCKHPTKQGYSNSNSDMHIDTPPYEEQEVKEV